MKLKKIRVRFNNYLQKMNTIFAEATTSEQLFESTLEGAEFFGFNRLFVCICEGIEKVDKSIKESVTGEKKYGLTDRMVSVVKYGHDVFNGTSFDTKKLLPVDIFHESKPCFIAFSPMYFKMRFLGYIAYDPSIIISDKGDLVATWIMQLENHAGTFYMNNELSDAMGELQKLYLRDPLTGLYNRRGLNKLEKPYVEKALEEGKLAAIICADVDGLKKVNDNYGHEEGDNAIVRSSSALIRCFPVGSICVRTGGDEFLVISSFDDERELKRSIKDVYRNLLEYNEISNKPYKVGCSCGYALVPRSGEYDLDEIQKQADKNMYDEKLKRKAVRKD